MSDEFHKGKEMACWKGIYSIVNNIWVSLRESRDCDFSKNHIIKYILEG